jgi:hypothetical protein
MTLEGPRQGELKRILNISSTKIEILFCLRFLLFHAITKYTDIDFERTLGFGAGNLIEVGNSGADDTEDHHVD